MKRRIRVFWWPPFWIYNFFAHFPWENLGKFFILSYWHADRSKSTEKSFDLINSYVRFRFTGLFPKCSIVGGQLWFRGNSMQKLCQYFKNVEKGPNNTKKLVDSLKYCWIQNGVHISKWPPTCMRKINKSSENVFYLSVLQDLNKNYYVFTHA